MDANLGLLIVRVLVRRCRALLDCVTANNVSATASACRIGSHELTASEFAELGALGALPERAVEASKVIPACVRIVPDPLHALGQAVVVLQRSAVSQSAHGMVADDIPRHIETSGPWCALRVWW